MENKTNRWAALCRPQFLPGSLICDCHLNSQEPISSLTSDSDGCVLLDLDSIAYTI